MENKVVFNKNWISWLIGFTDAEGNFQIFPKKRVLASGEIVRYNVGYSYHLSLHNRDSNILRDIQEKLGIGIIYEYKNKPDCRLAVNKKSDLLYLINNIFNKYPLITKNQFIRYHLLKNGIINEITEFKTLKEYQEYKAKNLLSITNEVNSQKSDNLFKNLSIDNWIIGFINGEGCFYLNKKKCNFFIEHTDKQALEIIKNRLLFGPNILERSPRNRDIGKIRKTTYQLIISSKKDIENLVMLLDNNDNISLKGNKYIQYIEWKQYIK
jgi:LAGLIDADG endonuclease